ncbi:MnuA family membrane nuclease [Mycoplasmopsis pullorum]|uniref:MnuA family membrane nuclease n=1 Tax=Mycoplasmopsis pullorum TaxID=48003 RepID=UPI001119D899|nr:hypothetical protein [Mycoplasmopsis pullorum]TNK83891.1 hypothetical protein C4M93_00740 [Mycoplasmopsis pullorum]
MKKRRNKKANTAISLISSLIALGAIGTASYFGYDKFFKKSTQETKKTSTLVPEFKDFVPLAEDSIRVMNWNILNFGGNENSKKLLPKINNIVKAIKYSNATVVGFTEINYIDPKERKSGVVSDLEDIQSLLGEDWKFIINDSVVNPKFPNSRENYAIFYNSKLVEYDNFKENVTTKNIYTRPPFLARFKVKENDYKFYYSIAHFDAPGANEKNGEVLDSQYKPNGTQEITEAKSVYELIFKPKENENIDIIFGGDTNLYQKSNEIFESFSKYGVLSAYTDFENRLNDQYYNTSLSKSKNGVVKCKYANPYDKWLYKDFGIKNINLNPDALFKIDIVGLYNLKVWDKQDDIKKWESAKKNLSDKTDLTLANLTSDHAPIIIDIKFK